MSNSKGVKSSNLTKVSMNLTDRDLENAAYLLKELNERNQASVVSKSLSITKDIVELIRSSKKLLIEESGGELREIKFIGL